MKTVTVTVQLPVDEAEAIAADDYPQTSSIFASVRARARFRDAATVALAMKRVDEAQAAYQLAEQGHRP